MKKLICSILFVMALVPLMNAQTVIQGTSSASGGASGDIMFGAKAGLNISTFLGRDYVDITPKIGAYVGGLAEIPVFMDDFYFQPELMISFQGADIGSGNLNLTYIHLPLMGKYHITEEIAVEFGPQIGFVIGDNGGDFTAGNAVTALKTKPFHLALNFGGGYRLDENLYFQARFSLGLTKVIDNTTVKNGVFQIGGAYFF